MKKIPGVISSPRKLGNCEIMVKEICHNLSEPHELRLLLGILGIKIFI